MGISKGYEDNIDEYPGFYMSLQGEKEKETERERERDFDFESTEWSNVPCVPLARKTFQTRPLKKAMLNTSPYGFCPVRPSKTYQVTPRRYAKQVNWPIE